MPPGSPVAYFDTLPIAHADRPDDRLLVVGATLVAAATVGGQFVADDTIVLLGVELDLDWPDGQPHRQLMLEGGKRADGAAKGRVTPVNNGHSRSTTDTRKPDLTRDVTL
jgi:hypothetical protein